MSDSVLLTQMLTIGQAIELLVPMPRSGRVQVYFSQVIDISNGLIHISSPQRQGLVAYRLRLGDKVKYQIVYKGISHLLLSQLVAWREDPDGVVIDWPTEIQRIQRRHFVRVKVELPVHIFPVQAEVDDVPEPEEIIYTHSTDLSGGGMMLQTSQPLEMHSYLEIRLNLPPENSYKPTIHTLAFQAQVCRCLKSSSEEDIFATEDNKASSPFYEIGLNFFNLSDYSRDRIMRYIFRVERERLVN